VHADTSGWQTYRSDQGEFEFRYPPDLSPKAQKGTHCVDDVCRPLESWQFHRGDSDKGSTTQVIHMSIQRQLVKGGRSLVSEFESEVGRALDPATERAVEIDGVQAIRTKGIVTWSSFDSTTQAVTKSQRPIDQVFLLLNGTDLLKIIDDVPGTAFDKDFEALVASIKVHATTTKK
jgi:hypothetical protein